MAVVAPHHLATFAGLEALRNGGHAVDAAIATNAVLGVVLPDSCGIGGDAFWLIWDTTMRRQFALNGSGRSGRRVDAAGIRALGHATVPSRGGLSITVPGAVRSWGEAHKKFGRLSRMQVLAPAIELARRGFPASTEFIDAVEVTAQVVHDTLGAQADFFKIYRPRSRPWLPGERVTMPGLANTLEHLAQAGFDAFYEGDLAERQAHTLEEAGSAIDAIDLADHIATWTDPIATTYRGVRVTTHPPNSSGTVALELLNILEQFEPPAPAAFGSAGVDGSRWIHLGIEAAKLAMADRDRYLTDPAFRDIPLTHLLSKPHAAELARRIDLARAAEFGLASNPPGGGTIYLAAVDAEGNAVSLIQSNYLRFGSGVVDPITGVTYQNRGSYFSLDPSHPNVLEPGKRTLHTLLPGMLFRDDPMTREPRAWVVAGSMGGDAQPQIHAQMVSALVDGDVDVAVAVGAPRWFVRPDYIYGPIVEVQAEPRFGPGILEELAQLGHPVTRTAPFDERLGYAHAIEFVDGGPEFVSQSLSAATDPRSNGLPAVW